MRFCDVLRISTPFLSRPTVDRDRTQTPRGDAVGQSRKNNIEGISIDQKLVAEGITQLSSEIKVLEAWLDELKVTGPGNSEVEAARKSYHDMLQSRREMLSALSQHARNTSLNGKS